MLTSIELTDFKAFHHLSLEFAGLTILLGPNNSGKSSIIAPIRLLAQTMQSADPDIALLLDGPLGDFGTFRDMVHGNHRGRPMGIRMQIDDDTEPEGQRSSVDIALEFKYRTQRRELVVREATIKLDGGHLVTAELSSDAQRHVITRLESRPIPAAQRSSVSDFLRMRHFVPQLYSYPRRRSASAPPLFASEVEAAEDLADYAVWIVNHTLANTEYLSAMRQPPERTYHQTGVARTRVGQTGDNWAGLFVLDSAKTAKTRMIVPALTRWLRRAGLASDVKLNWLSDRHYEIQIQHPQTKEFQNLADVGQANSQVIPVLVGGLRLPPGSTYLVEEPEIHLHPGAQAELGDFFVDLLKRGVHSIVETHSEYLILRLQQQVAIGKLAPEDIRFVYVDATVAGKRARVLRLDSDARFTEPLDGGFFPQRLEEARKLAKIRGSKT